MAYEIKKRMSHIKVALDNVVAAPAEAGSAATER
jgi:hypothetical protein